MKILVTGSAGFIGSHMAEALATQGHEVIGLDCISDYYLTSLKELNVSEIEKNGVTFVKKDLVTDDLSDVVSGVEVVFHFAAQPGLSSTVPFDLYERNNVTATYKLLEAVKNLKTLKFFVNIATSSVYGLYAKGDELDAPSPASFYGVTKLSAEQLALSYFYSSKLPVSSFRLFSVYGERERPDKFYPKLIASILENREVSLFEGSDKHIRSTTYVGDVVKGLLVALEKKEKCIGQVFNLGNDRVVTIGEGIATIEDLMGKKANLKIVPKRAGDQLETHANISKIKSILGYNPTTTPREGLSNEIEWVKKVLSKGIKL